MRFTGKSVNGHFVNWRRFNFYIFPFCFSLKSKGIAPLRVAVDAQMEMITKLMDKLNVDYTAEVNSLQHNRGNKELFRMVEVPKYEELGEEDTETMEAVDRMIRRYVSKI